MKLDILAFGAHPDDVELGCAGTLAKEISLGKKVGIIDLTQGELGTRGSAELRRKEADEAARILQISVRENLCFADGFFLNDKHHQLEIVKKLRKYRPEIVICNPFDDRHIETTDENGNSQEAWRPKVVYHYIQWKDLRPDFVVDITGFLEKKIEAVYAYRSQFLPDEGNDPQTVITSQNFQDSIKFRAQELGMLINRDYAEGFNVERYVAVDNLSDLI